MRAYQALGEDADDRRGGQKGLDPHLHQPRQGTGGVVGVQGGENHVAGQRRLHGDLGGLAVADLADHDDVRVLAQDRPQAGGKGQADLRVDLDLADPGKLVLDRVLDRDDVLLPAVEPGEGGVEGGRLARAGRPGDQEDAVALLDHAVHQPQHFRRHADVFQGEDVGGLVEQAQHHPFAEGSGQGRDAHVDVLAGDAHPETAVLGEALFCDIEAGHDLQPRE